MYNFGSCICRREADLFFYLHFCFRRCIKYNLTSLINRNKLKPWFVINPLCGTSFISTPDL
jgi:hypothetical protein